MRGEVSETPEERVRFSKEMRDRVNYEVYLITDLGWANYLFLDGKINGLEKEFMEKNPTCTYGDILRNREVLADFKAKLKERGKRLEKKKSPLPIKNFEELNRKLIEAQAV